MIVVDANLMITMVSGDVRGNLVLQKFNEWLGRQIELHAPGLAQYEVANGIARLVATGKITADKITGLCHQIELLPVTYHKLTNASRAVEIAITLKRQNAYDASYLALAESLGAELWTLDGPLYRNASLQGFPVKLLSQ
ncbi:MAG: type II toxin-antitoxin system VapC family toxin [Acidobacteriota bacterium]|nr:type II toxin-antitoxin system VapC family toxin [Acidobacteriota bacterium]